MNGIVSGKSEKPDFIFEVEQSYEITSLTTPVLQKYWQNPYYMRILNDAGQVVLFVSSQMWNGNENKQTQYIFQSSKGYSARLYCYVDNHYNLFISTPSDGYSTYIKSVDFGIVT